MGDGCLQKTNKICKHYSFSLTCRHKEYLEWTIQQFSLLTNSKIAYRKRFDKRHQKYWECYEFRSRSNQFFTEQRERWYPEGKKIFPVDSTINQASLLRFYLEDGSPITQWTSKQKTRRSIYGVAFAICGLSEESAFLLATKISNYCNLQATISHVNGLPNMLTIHGKNNARSFFRILGDCPVSCYSYKWIQE